MDNIKPIKAEADYEAALAEIERLWGAEPDTPEGDRLDVLAMLVERYEENRWPVGLPDPIEAIVFGMEQSGYSQSQLAVLLGSPSRASEILHRKRQLTLPMIRLLNEQWNIPAESLIRQYELSP